MFCRIVWRLIEDILGPENRVFSGGTGSKVILTFTKEVQELSWLPHDHINNIRPNYIAELY